LKAKSKRTNYLKERETSAKRASRGGGQNDEAFIFRLSEKEKVSSAVEKMRFESKKGRDAATESMGQGVCDTSRRN